MKVMGYREIVRQNIIQNNNYYSWRILFNEVTLHPGALHVCSYVTCLLLLLKADLSASAYQPLHVAGLLSLFGLGTVKFFNCLTMEFVRYILIKVQVGLEGHPLLSKKSFESVNLIYI